MTRRVCYAIQSKCLVIKLKSSLSLYTVWVRVMVRAAAHSDCCFSAPCTNILTYSLTYLRLVHEGRFHGVSRTIMLYVVIWWSNTKYLYLPTSALSHIGHVDNITECWGPKMIAKWMYIAQWPLDSAPVLGNLCEYRITRSSSFKVTDLRANRKLTYKRPPDSD